LAEHFSTQVVLFSFTHLCVKLPRPVDSEVTFTVSCAGCREFESQRPAKYNTTLQTARHRFNIYANNSVTLALWRGDGHRKLVTHFRVIRRV